MPSNPPSLSSIPPNSFLCASHLWDISSIFIIVPHVNGSHPFTLACSFSPPLIPSDAYGPTYLIVQASNFFHLSASQYYPCRVCLSGPPEPMTPHIPFAPACLWPSPHPPTSSFSPGAPSFSRCLVPMSRPLGTALPGNKMFPLLRISKKAFSSLDI